MAFAERFVESNFVKKSKSTDKGNLINTRYLDFQKVPQDLSSEALNCHEIRRKVISLINNGIKYRK